MIDHHAVSRGRHQGAGPYLIPGSHIKDPRSPVSAGPWVHLATRLQPSQVSHFLPGLIAKRLRGRRLIMHCKAEHIAYVRCVCTKEIFRTPLSSYQPESCLVPVTCRTRPVLLPSLWAALRRCIRGHMTGLGLAVLRNGHDRGTRAGSRTGEPHKEGGPERRGRR